MSYIDRMQNKLYVLRNKEDFFILSIESSCDETAVAITKGKKVFANKISSQIEIHKRFGGVVPEIASRNHILAIDSIIDEALEEAGITLGDISVVAVTYGAGLLGALLVGVAYAKSLAYSLDIPLVGINHIKGHICANFVENQNLEFPFICLLASGGHTAIMKVNGYHNSQILGSTKDDAAGEAFDKVARVLGLSYPGGPEIEKLAQKGKNNIYMPRAFKNENHLNFSYSGLKTAVINYVHNSKAKGIEIVPEDVACSFQTEAVGVLIDNAIKASKQEEINKIVLAGGVGANSALREGLQKAGKENGIEIILPSKKLCTDNAVMIGIAAKIAIDEGIMASGLELDAKANI